jgi:hypothetical protein
VPDEAPSTAVRSGGGNAGDRAAHGGRAAEPQAAGSTKAGNNKARRKNAGDAQVLQDQAAENTAGGGAEELPAEAHRDHTVLTAAKSQRDLSSDALHGLGGANVKRGLSTDALNSLGYRGELTIPKLFHQSWRDDGFPKDMFNWRWQV